MPSVPPATPHPRTGRVVAVCASPLLQDGLGKAPRDVIEVTRLGVPGDHHHGETRWSGSRRARIPNDRPITVIATEAVRDACGALGIPPPGAGAFGENLLVEGLGDLGDLGAGDLLTVRPAGHGEASVVLEVTEQNEPCAKLRVRDGRMPKAMVGRRGVIAVVRREGFVRPGDTVELSRG